MTDIATTDLDAHLKYANEWLDDRAGAPTTARAELVADGLAVRLRDLCMDLKENAAAISPRPTSTQRLLIATLAAHIAAGSALETAGTEHVVLRSVAIAKRIILECDP